MTYDIQNHVNGAEVQGESSAASHEESTVANVEVLGASPATSSDEAGEPTDTTGADAKDKNADDQPKPTTYDLMLGDCYRDQFGKPYFWDVGENGNRPVYLDTKDAIDTYCYQELLESKAWPKKKDAKEAIDKLRVVTKKTRPDKPLHLRVQKYGENGDGIELKITSTESVKITAEKVDATGGHVGHFLNPSHELPLAMPVMDGFMKPYLDALGLADGDNQVDQDNRVLITGLLLVYLYPNIPYPMLVVSGAQGSGKTTFCESIVRLIDNSLITRSPRQKTERDVFAYANNSRVLSFDNVSVMSGERCDVHCTIATGGEVTARRLYTNADMSMVKLGNPQIFNGIPNIFSMDDFRQRSILIELPLPENRVSLDEYQRGIESTKAGALGHLIRAMQTAMQNLDSTPTPTGIRMADAARLVTAAESAFGWESGTFAAAYCRNQQKTMMQSLSMHPVYEVLDRLLRRNTGRRIEATATELLNMLEAEATLLNPKLLADEKWPKSASALSGSLKRLEGSLAEVGIGIAPDRTSESRNLIITDSRQPVG